MSPYVIQTTLAAGIGTNFTIFFLTHPELTQAACIGMLFCLATVWLGIKGMVQYIEKENRQY